ncbi:hypothetical protein K440DRAFT_659974 [Wilcoxina mikolae CBS 423.85]|nr:hypothetical protein K440DRAFT_659974 [Wilcoxina mikolae CBS 423.85]
MDTFHAILSGGSSGRLFALHRSLSMNHSQIGSFLSSEYVRADFITNFSRYVENLENFLSFSAKHSDSRHPGNKHFANEIIDLVISVLSHAEFDLADSDSLLKLLIAALNYGLPYQPASLKTIAMKLAEKTGLLKRIVSSTDGAETINKLFQVHFVNSVPSICDAWARKLVGFCLDCTKIPTCHDIDFEVGDWQTLADAIEHLEDQYPSVPLGPVTGHSSHPEHVIFAIRELQHQYPGANCKVDVLLQQIRGTDIPVLVRAILSTYPCRSCHELAKDSNSRPARSLNQSTYTDPQNIMKEDTLFGGPIGLWKIICPDPVLKDMQRQKLAGNSDLLEARIRRLASGDWKRGKLSTLVGTASQKKHVGKFPLLLAKVGKKLRILWQLGVAPCEGGIAIQHIKIWRVVDREDVPQAIEHVVRVWRSGILRLHHYDIDIPRLWEYPIRDNSGVYVPSCETFDPTNSQTSSSTARRDLPISNSASDRRALQAYNKFYAFTEPVMDAFRENNIFAEFPPDTSPEEIEVINHHRSGTLIMGRSGTGKTTCLVHKLMRNYVVSRSSGQAPARQILLTCSKYLAKQLRDSTKNLIRSQLSEMATEENFDHHVLNLGEENLTLSNSWTTLESDDYPLVCTFEQLLKLLENDVEYFDRQKPRHERSRISQRTKSSGGYVRRSQFVDFRLFRSEYWKKFPYGLTRNMEPGLVFAEFMGVIKGSATNNSTLRSLSREEYLELSDKQAPTFYGQREQVYDLYLRYESQKSVYGDKDSTDRVKSLLKMLESDSELKRSVEGSLDELYVDEVQDQRCLDIILLLKLVLNPRGIHLAGDTAQCISKDSTFRFNHVKTLFYEKFSGLAKATNNREVAVPVMFKLTRNFRSHQGIIALASFIMRLLVKAFPQTVDKMDEEKSECGGPKPVLFVGSDLGERALKSGPFGPGQVVLVRDDDTKKKVLDKHRDVALVLTILESKGMEFDDVLLLDFFSDSPCHSGFRKLNEFYTTGYLEYAIGSNATLCSELKNLYVAVTRSRNQLWIFERSSVKPVEMMFTENENHTDPLVDIVKNGPNTDNVLNLLRQESSGDLGYESLQRAYSERGYELLQRELFKEAKFCFNRAGDIKGQKITDAHIHMEDGRGHRADGDYERFLELFESAEKIFRESKQLENAAFCLEEMARLEDAGDTWVEIGQLKKAASLFMQCQSWKKSFNCYDQLNSCDDAAAALFQGHLFNKLVKYLAENRNRIDPSQMAGYGKICTILLSQNRIRRDHEEFLVEAVGSDEEKEAFFREYRLKEQLATVLVKKLDYGQLFQELLSDGKILEALDVGLEHIQTDPTIPSHEVIMLLHYREFEKLSDILFATSAGETNTNNTRHQPSALPSSVSQALDEWTSFLEKVQRNSTCLGDVFTDLGDGLRLHYDILCVAIAFHWLKLDLFGRVKSITDLRYIVHALRKTVSLWASIKDDQELPLPIAVVFGAFRHSQKLEISLLDYSPLPSEHEQAKVSLYTREMLLVQMIGLYDKLDEVGMEFWVPQNHKLCARHYKHGCWELESCDRRHQQLNRDECKTRIQELKIIYSLLCSFHIVYQRVGRTIPWQVFGQKYQPRRRRWLEFLLLEITFRSALENDCEAVANAFDEITIGGTEFTIISCALEELLFHRLRKDREWWVRNDLSSLLEQMQLAHNLGSSVAYGFQRYVRPFRVFPYIYDRWSPAQKHQQLVYQTIDHLQQALRHAKEASPTGFRINLENGLNAFNQLNDEDFRCFHSIIGIYERFGTFLFLVMCETACVIPLSWTKLHLPQVVSSSTQIATARQNKNIYGQCLFILLDSFMGLVSYLDELRGFRYTYGTRKRDGELVRASAFGQGIQERSRNFLVIALINLAAMHDQLPFSPMVCRNAQMVLQCRSLLAYDFQSCSPQALSRELHRSFTRYQGKDVLTLVTTQGTTPDILPDVLVPLDRYGVPTHTLQSLIKSACTPNRDPSTPPPATHSQDDGPLEEEVTDAALKLQRFWQKRRPYLHSHRSALETLHGKANALIFDSIRHIPRKDINKSIIRRNYILLTKGVDLYTNIWALRAQAEKAHALSDRVLANTNISVESLEDLISGDLLKSLKAIRVLLGREGNIFERAGSSAVALMYPEMEPEDMEELFEKLNDELGEMETRLGNIVDGLRGMN